MVDVYLAALVVLLTVQRGGELWLARRNRLWSLSNGAIELGSRHYALFFLLHGGWFLSWLIEGRIVAQISSWWTLWLCLFALAQGLRYWCILSLGHHWNTRILVIPGARAVKKGPYRFLRHPNYIAVAVEFIAVPMMFSAWRTAVLASLLNAILLCFIRLPQEEKAIRLLRWD